MQISTITATTFTSSVAFPKLPRRRFIVNEVHNTSLTGSKSKRAYLQARRKERIKLPNYDADCGGHTFFFFFDKYCGGHTSYHISEFLSHPSGVEAILNTKALQSFQSIDSNLYRCSMPEIKFLNVEVAPLLDLRVTPTTEDCIVEMISCKFQGSEVVERQNNKFSASMRNHITWDTHDSEWYMDIDVKLELILEIFTRPFTSLPIAAVERPGNLMMQALVDRLVPLLLEQLLQDYDNWVRQKRENHPREKNEERGDEMQAQSI